MDEATKEKYRQYVLADWKYRTGEDSIPEHLMDDLCNDSFTQACFLEDNNLPEDTEFGHG